MFREELRSRGWIEGRNLTIVPAFADARAERLPALAKDLVHRRVDAIFAFLTEAAVAAARATDAIPIVFGGVPWPVETGLVESFARPGRNVTGVATQTGIEVSTKRLEYLKAFAPSVTRLSWILDADMQTTVGGDMVDIKPALVAAAQRVGFETRFHVVRKDEDFERAFAEIAGWRAQALAVAGSAATVAAADRIFAFALRHRMPTTCPSRTLAQAGCLFTYGAAGGFTETMARAADYVDRVLRGARPADLPVHRPDKFDLVVNRGTARALGLAIPPSVQFYVTDTIP